MSLSTTKEPSFGRAPWSRRRWRWPPRLWPRSRSAAQPCLEDLQLKSLEDLALNLRRRVAERLRQVRYPRQLFGELFGFSLLALGTDLGEPPFEGLLLLSQLADSLGGQLGQPAAVRRELP
jgi:hypothetical protein